jgi:hypothetical protein
LNKKHNLIVIACAAIIAVAILLFRRVSPGVSSGTGRHEQTFQPSVYRVVNGWGYDILVNDKLLIRQESIPVIQDNRPFPTKIQAENTAALVIKKLENGQHPSLTMTDIESILPVYKTEHDKKESQ